VKLFFENQDTQNRTKFWDALSTAPNQKVQEGATLLIKVIKVA